MAFYIKIGFRKSNLNMSREGLKHMLFLSAGQITNLHTVMMFYEMGTLKKKSRGKTKQDNIKLRLMKT